MGEFALRSSRAKHPPRPAREVELVNLYGPTEGEMTLWTVPRGKALRPSQMGDLLGLDRTSLLLLAGPRMGLKQGHSQWRKTSTLVQL